MVCEKHILPNFCALGKFGHPRLGQSKLGVTLCLLCFFRNKISMCEDYSVPLILYLFPISLNYKKMSEFFFILNYNYN